MTVLNSSISINQINYAIALYETGSFSEAADLCCISQSTLSTMIKKLENQINFQLFDRKTKPVELTKEGKLLIGQFKIIHNEYDILLEMAQEAKEAFYGTLNIGIIPTLAPFLLPLFLDKLLTNYPKVEFKIYEITTNEIVNRLKLRELDIGVLSIPIKDKELIETSLFEEDFLVYDARKYSKKKNKYKINDIDVSRLWLLEESHCLSSQIGKICHLKKKHKANRNLVFNSGSILSLLGLVNLNKGITLLPQLVTLQNKIVNQKFVYSLQSPVPVREIGLVTFKHFTKKRLFKILEQEIITAVKPLVKNTRKMHIIEPF